jgi:uncharacterized membrane protein YdjX (TVP38/TMEM64 family)
MTQLVDALIVSQQYFRDLGWLGILFWAAIIVALQLVFIPLSPSAIAAGFMFGLPGGLLAITIGTMTGAALNFVLSRKFARGAIARRLEQNPKFQLIDAAIGREGWKIIALLRFCPIPFGFANYAYGMTAIRFWPYFLATVVAIIPGNVLFAWIGATASAGLEVALGTNRPRHPAEYALFGAGLVAACVAMAYIGRIARAALQDLPGAAAIAQHD